METKRKELIIVNNFKDNVLYLNDIELTDEIIKKNNIQVTGLNGGYKVLYRNGKILNDFTLYRIGGLNNFDSSKKYNIILKYTPSFYSKGFMIKCYPEDKSKHKKTPRMKSTWVIIDNLGVEKVVSKKEHLSTLRLIDNSCIYKVGNKYYNIETKKLYCESYNTIESDSYLFLEASNYDTKKERQGVYKINKLTGKFTIIK